VCVLCVCACVCVCVCVCKAVLFPSIYYYITTNTEVIIGGLNIYLTLLNLSDFTALIHTTVSHSGGLAENQH